MSEGAPEVLGLLVADPGTPHEQSIPIYDRLFVGRECVGVDVGRRFLIDEERVSRNHFDIRLRVDQDRAFVVDTSTNGTRLNGTRIERSVPVQIRSGDRLQAGNKEFEFRSSKFSASDSLDPLRTLRSIRVTEMGMVVGDILSFSAISQYTDEGVLLESIDALYAELCKVLAQHHGTLSNYVGDAFFATWEVGSTPAALVSAVSFALDADDKVREFAPHLKLRDPTGAPLRMAWGIASGAAAITTITGMLTTVVGDTANVAFRLSAMAGRGGWTDVLVTRAVREQTVDHFSFTEPAEIEVKGRTGTETVYGPARLDRVLQARPGEGTTSSGPRP